jgi:hypothetical protein
LPVGFMNARREHRRIVTHKAGESAWSGGVYGALTSMVMSPSGQATERSRTFPARPSGRGATGSFNLADKDHATMHSAMAKRKFSSSKPVSRDTTSAPCFPLSDPHANAALTYVSHAALWEPVAHSSRRGLVQRDRAVGRQDGDAVSQALCRLELAGEPQPRKKLVSKHRSERIGGNDVGHISIISAEGWRGWPDKKISYNCH